MNFRLSEMLARFVRTGFLVVLCLLVSSPGEAAQQFQGLCSYIRIEILQELALERIGFLATLEVTNNEGDAVLTDFSATLTFAHTDKDGIVTDASDLFFVQPPELLGISSIDNGLIEPGETATVTWFIIPKISAGGESPAGVGYQVSAELGGSLYGSQIDPAVLRVIPDTITVKPDPQLDITYFQPRDVDGDDPFTKYIVESPVPFTLGVLVENGGFGRAKQVTIHSEQPKIVENREDLLEIPRLIGSRINDNPTNHASLTVDLGDIEPGGCRKAAWDMISTLSGEFTAFKASYTHKSELGGEATSLIRSINAYFIVHEVLNDQPGRDDLLDFLAVTDPTQTDLVPDTLFETDCSTLPVNTLTDASAVSYSGRTATIRVKANIENWGFIRVIDPAQAKLAIESVVRSDGKVLNLHNAWTNTRYARFTNEQLNYLNLLDKVALGDYEYVVTYSAPASDVTAPKTQLLLSGPQERTADMIYVVPSTEFFFIAEDENPVAMSYRVDDDEFRPAYPFTLPAGNYRLEYYSVDAAGNAEETQFAAVTVVGDYPAVTQYQSSGSELVVAGDAVSVRPTGVQLSFVGTSGAASLEGQVEVYQGVYAFPTLRGLPSSPTQVDQATLTVGGENVDYYRYRLGAGTWSDEQSVASSLVLTNLSGPVELVVQARSQYGAFAADASGDLLVRWQVDSGAPSTTVATPETPSRSVNADLEITGAALYRYTIDSGYFRAELAVSSPIALRDLAEGEHDVAVIGRSNTDAFPSEDAATHARWRIDRQYGYRLPAERIVYSETLGHLGEAASFSWHGRTSSGVAAEPGWYTVKVTVTDGLGRSTSATKLVHVGDLLPTPKSLADAPDLRQKQAQARGSWAVWQDQRTGTWNIMARRLDTNPAGSDNAEISITQGSLNQQSPRTDGQYVVWQGRQADGTWDVFGKKLGSDEPVFSVTQSSLRHETRPVVHFPWVAYQAQPSDVPNAPWQIRIANLITHSDELLDSTSYDQLDPAIDRGRVVWQDFRDVGVGEVYLKDLNEPGVRRITTNPGGQYHPVIDEHWIVWEDNRNLQVDLYGFNLLRGVEVRLTNSPEDETRPSINDKWVVYEEDSAGEQRINFRVLLLPALASVQLTNTTSNKELPSLASGHVVWTDYVSGHEQALQAPLTDLQPVFNNRNAVAVTESLLRFYRRGSDLLRLWHREANVTELTRVNQLIPNVVTHTVKWVGNDVDGEDFELVPGDFLWVKFDSTKILDLGGNDCKPQDLAAGVNAVTSNCFADGQTAYSLIRTLGAQNVNAVRMLDSEAGRWFVARTADGQIVGEDFSIRRLAVLLVDMHRGVSGWRP